MICSRKLCGKDDAQWSSPRRDNIVYGEYFCNSHCAFAEAAVRKQKRRRQLGLDKEVRKVRDLKKLYKMSLGFWQQMWDDQGGKCALCFQPFDQNIKELEAHVDHDHSCCKVRPTCGKCTRGLLCTNCNHGIGKLQDSPQILMRAANYVNGRAAAFSQGK